MRDKRRGETIRWWLTFYLATVLLGTILLIGGVVPESWIGDWSWWQRMLLCFLGAPAVLVVYVIANGVISATPHVFRASPAAGIVLITIIVAVATIWGKLVA